MVQAQLALPALLEQLAAIVFAQVHHPRLLETVLRDAGPTRL